MQLLSPIKDDPLGVQTIPKGPKYLKSLDMGIWVFMQDICILIRNSLICLEFAQNLVCLFVVR
jgi:hypothetical protein